MRNRLAAARGAALLTTLAATLGGCADVTDADDVATAETDDALYTASGPNLTWRVTNQFQNSGELRAFVDRLADDEIDLDAVAVSPGGHWIAVSATGEIAKSASFPSAVYSAVLQLRAGGQRILAIDFNAQGNWVVAGSTSWLHSAALPPNTATTVDRYYTNGWAIRDLDLTSSGYVVVGAGNRVDSQGLDLELKMFLDDRIASKRDIQVVDVHFDGRWAAVAAQESASAHASSQLQNQLRTNSINAHTASRFTFGLGDDYVLFCNGQSMPHEGVPIDEIEYDLGARRTTIWRRMDEAKIPGLAIALIENNRITHVRGYGVLRDDIERQVLATTAFDLASMSKFPSALLVSRLDELGTVDLDANILANPGAIVANWRTRGDAAESAQLPTAISLRQLLSHTGGIRADGGSPGIHERYWDRLPLDIGDLLMGYRCDGSIFGPCRFDPSKRVWTDRAPGTMQQYANAGFLLAEAVVRDATGKTGADRLQKLIFEPLGLSNTSGATPLPYPIQYWAAWQHGQDGRRSGRTLYPWTFAGGIYASAADYARMMILALDEGRDENGVQRIGANAIQQLLTRVLWNPGSSGKGLGLELILAPGTTTTRSFYHGGRHSGEARNEMCGNVRTGDGIVVLTNSDSDPDGSDPVDQVIDEIIQTYVAAQDDWGSDRCAQGPLPPPV